MKKPLILITNDDGIDSKGIRFLVSVMKKSFISYKNDEWERYHQAVTDWEVKEYLRLY